MAGYILRNLDELKSVLKYPGIESLYEILYEDCNEPRDDSPDLRENLLLLPLMLRSQNRKWSRHISVHLKKEKFKISGPDVPGTAEHIKKPREYWQLLISDKIQQLIIESTNANLADMISYVDAVDKPNFQPITLPELHAFIGLMYLYALDKMSHPSLSFGSWIETHLTARSAMKESRFWTLLRFLRFDGKESEKVQQSEIGTLTQKALFPIRKVWDEFFSCCQMQYRTSPYCTIDEQIYNTFDAPNVESLPEKFKPQITLAVLNDARTGYLLNAIPHVSFESFTPPTRYYVEEVSKPVHHIPNMTLITSKRYTTMEVVRHMKYRNITVTGVVQKDSPDVPHELTISRKVDSFVIYKCHDHMSLISYIPRENKVMLLLSSITKRPNFDIQNRPDIMRYYKQMNGGTKYFHHLCGRYSVRLSLYKDVSYWPMIFFLGMLDQAGLNALILYTCNSGNERLSKRIFLEMLGVSLISSTVPIQPS